MAEEKKTIRLIDLRKQSVPLEVEYEGGTITLEFRPYVVTPAFEVALQAAVAEGESDAEVFGAYRKAFTAGEPALLAGWNVEDVPLSYEGLGEFPDWALIAWWRAIQGHMNPNRPSAAG